MSKFRYPVTVAVSALPSDVASRVLKFAAGEVTGEKTLDPTVDVTVKVTAAEDEIISLQVADVDAKGNIAMSEVNVFMVTDTVPPQTPTFQVGAPEQVDDEEPTGVSE